MKIVWEDPPPRRSGRPRGSKYRHVMAELENHPGRWARINNFASLNSASSQRVRLRKSFPEHEFVIRKTDSGGALYARYPAVLDA